MRNIVNAFAEYERALIRARTRAALAVKRAKGERVGDVPFGYQLAADRVHLEPLAAEQNIIAAIRRLRGDGLSIREIAHGVPGMRRFKAEPRTGPACPRCLR